MQTKRIATIVTTVVVLALLLAASSTVAGPPIEGGSAGITLAGTVASKISYQGRLTDVGGNPLNGNYNLVFQLWDDATAGGQVGGDIVRNNVPVSNGLFTVELEVPQDAFNGQALWLRIQVNGQWLSPRQELLPVPYALSLRPGAAIDASIYDGPVLKVENTDANPAGGGYAIVGKNASGYTWRPAIYGENTGASAGVYGRSDGWHATVGWQAGNNPDHAGVYGYNAGAGPGVYGQSTGGFGITGRSENGYGGFFTSVNNDHFDLALGGAVGRINTDFTNEHSQLYLSSNADVIIKLDNDGGENHVLRVKNSGGTDVCTINEGGDLNCTGSKSAVVKTVNHGWRQLYAVESTEVWFEDFGTARLADGEATVAFDPIFADTVNLEVDYHVFLTPLCQEPVLLFVTAKSASGFAVRGATLDGRPASCAFDYRVVARRSGYEGMRLEETTWLGENTR